MHKYNTAGMGAFGSTWQSHGYSGNGNVKELIGSIAGRIVVVCGNAAGVFEELDFVRNKYEYERLVVFGVNDVGMYIDRLDHWVTLHDEPLAAWKSVRWATGRGLHDTKYHTYNPCPIANYVWAGLSPLFALSGYFAAQVAYIMGADSIILCGCPGSTTRRFFEAHPRLDFGYGDGKSQSDVNIKQQFVNEMNRLPDFRARMRSMSGWTRSYLGGL